MVDRTTALTAIQEVYRLRIAGDKPGLAELLAPNARLHLAGDATLMPGVATGPAEAMPTISALIDTFEFHKHELLDAVVEGDKAAVLSRITVSRPGGDTVSTEVYDLWTFGDDGRPASIHQFVDTALVRRLMDLT